MSKEVITTALLVIATVVAVTVFTASMLPSVRDLLNAYSSLTNKLSDRVKTDIKIIFIKVNDTELTFWVKNIGTNRIPLPMLNLSDVFVVSNNVSYHFTLSDSSISYVIENNDGDNYWESGETLRITINLSLSSDDYLLIFVLYNGVKTSDVFSK